MRAPFSTGVKALQGVSQGGKAASLTFVAVLFTSATMLTMLVRRLRSHDPSSADHFGHELLQFLTAETGGGWLSGRHGCGLCPGSLGAALRAQLQCLTWSAWFLLGAPLRPTAVRSFVDVMRTEQPGAVNAGSWPSGFSKRIGSHSDENAPAGQKPRRA